MLVIEILIAIAMVLPNMEPQLVALNIGLFALALAIIIKGGHLFTDSAVGLAKHFGVPRVVIGLTVVSFATTTPEFAVSTMAAYFGNVEIAYGNVVGSTIANIALILAVAIISRDILAERIVLRDWLSMLGFGIAATLMALDGVVGFLNGVTLLTAALLYAGYVIRRERSSVDNNAKEKGDLKKIMGRFATGALTIVFGSRLLIYSGVNVARILGVPEIVIALTLISVGTSLPELVTAAISTMKRVSDISLGNIIGANILDIAWVLGASAAVRPLPVHTNTLLMDNSMMLLVMFMPLIFISLQKKLDRKVGIVLLVLYLAYVGALYTVRGV